jgi:hypothetical protein
MQSKEDTMVSWAPGVRDPEPPRQASHADGVQAEHGDEKKDKEIASFPSPLAPFATSGSKQRYEFLPRAPDFLRFIRSPAAEPWILGPRFRGSWPWASHRRGGSGRSAADSWPFAWGYGRKDSRCWIRV